jgi:signal transduction histidine kinase
MKTRDTIKSGGGTDIAFALVVLASYFATFSNIPDVPLLWLFLMVVLGSAYMALGIYGYRYCARNSSQLLSLAYFALQVPVGGLIVYLGKGAGFNALILLPLAAHSVVLLSSSWMAAANATIIAAYLASMFFSANTWDAIWTGLPTFLAGQVFIVFFTQLAVSEQKGRSEVERLVHELEDANQQLREYALQAEELAISRERNRLAREIHDGLGHYLTTVNMQIGAARAVMEKNSNRAREILSKAQTLTQFALVDVRNSVAALHAPPGEHLSLTERIAALIKSSEVGGIECSFLVHGTNRPLSPQAQLTLYRAVQEGMNNAIKHGHPANIWIDLDYSTLQMVRLSIRDDGVGSKNISGGYGLLGLRERINLLKGKFETASEMGQGFLLQIEVPE